MKSCATVLLASLFGCAGFAAAAQPAEAPHYPTRPVRIVIGFTPGGTPDITARLIGARLSDSLGQPVVIENRPGAGGTIGAKLVADANPDGHTLLSASASHVLQPSIYSKLPYDTIRDFAGITRTSSACYMLVTAVSSEVGTAKDLIAAARAKPGSFNFASAGSGSGTHFAGEMFVNAAGIDAVHVPYKGIPESLNDTIAGRVQFFMSPIANAVSLVKEGKLRALGVSSRERDALVPEVPTIAESGVSGYESILWFGLLTSARTPQSIVSRINREVARILREPELRARWLPIGLEPRPTTPAQFDRIVAEDAAAFAKLARAATIRAE